MMYRPALVGVLGTLVAQAVPSDSQITTLIGSGITGGTVLAYAWWRQRHADELLKQRDATIAEMTKTVIEMVVPALEKTAASNVETRHALERIIEAQRRGEYDRSDEHRRGR